MIYRDKLEQEIINGIIELDQKNAVIAIGNLISINFFKTGEELLRHGHYISIDRVEKKCLFKVATYSQLERKELEEYFEHVCKTLLLIFVLLENLRDERYVLVVGDSTPSAIGSAFDDKFEKHRFAILYRELEEKILALSGKEFIPTKKLTDYVKNGFKTFEQFSLEQQINDFKITVKQQENSLFWTKVAVWIAAIGLFASALFSLLEILGKNDIVKVQLNDKVSVNIYNDSLKITSIKDSTTSMMLFIKSFKDSTVK